jgi:hypothetical protein
MTETIVLQQPELSPTQRLDNTLTRTKRELLTIRSVFPFDLFPDTLRIDENKIEIISRKFFSLEEHIFPILIKNINGVVVTTSPFFATVTFEITGHNTNPEPITMLKKREALLAKRIIMGLIAAQKDGKDGIDLSSIPIEQARAKLEEIGRAYEHS